MNGWSGENCILQMKYFLNERSSFYSHLFHCEGWLNALSHTASVQKILPKASLKKKKSL